MLINSNTSKGNSVGRFKRDVIVALFVIGCLFGVAIIGRTYSPTAAPIEHSSAIGIEVLKPTPWTQQPMLNDSVDFQFAIMSDRTGGMRRDVFSQAVDKVNLLQPEFVMCVGDLINGYTKDTTVLKAEYDEFDSIVNRLDMRFFRVVGNHDITNMTMSNLYHQRYGQSYYHFVYKNVLFLVVCTEDLPVRRVSDEQVAYMSKALADNSDVRWTFVFMHKPFFIEDPKHPHPGWQKIQDQLKDRTHTVFAGHWHEYTKYTINNQSYIRLATTGGSSELTGIKDGSFDHIVWVTMTDEGPRIANLMLDGIYDENVKVQE